MKVIRGILVFIINLILLVLIIALSFIIKTKIFVEKEMIISLIKQGILTSLQDDNITQEQQDIIDKVFDDEDFEKIVDRVVQNFLEYKSNDKYELSKDDYNMALDFVLKYKDEINSFSKTKYSEKEIRDLLKYEDASKAITGLFDSITEEDDSESVYDIVEVYTLITGFVGKAALLFVIIIVILLIMLVSWSLITWMLVTGIDLIISGSLIGSVYVLFEAVKTRIIADTTTLNIINSVNLTGFITMGIIEIIIGIVLIVVYSLLKKDKAKEPEEIQG